MVSTDDVPPVQVGSLKSSRICQLIVPYINITYVWVKGERFVGSCWGLRFTSLGEATVAFQKTHFC